MKNIKNQFLGKKYVNKPSSYPANVYSSPGVGGLLNLYHKLKPTHNYTHLNPILDNEKNQSSHHEIRRTPIVEINNGKAENKISNKNYLEGAGLKNKESLPDSDIDSSSSENSEKEGEEEKNNKKRKAIKLKPIKVDQAQLKNLSHKGGGNKSSKKLKTFVKHSFNIQ